MVRKKIGIKKLLLLITTIVFYLPSLSGNDSIYKFDVGLNSTTSFSHVISFYIDSSAPSAFTFILKKYQEKAFSQNRKEVLNFGYLNNTVWFHIPVQNMRTDENLLIELDFAQYNEVELFVLDSDFKIIDNQKQGVYHLKEHYPDVHRCPLFEITLAQGKTFHLFFKIKNEAPVMFPVFFHTNRSFLSKEKTKRLISFTLLGIVIATVIFNLIFFFITHNKAYLFLALHLLFIFGNFIFYFGYGYEYFSNLSPNLLLMLKYDFVNLSLIAHGLFFIYYLSLYKYKFLFLIEIVCISIMAFLFLLTITQSISVITVAKIIIFSYFIFSLIGIFLALIILLKKNRSALFYITAFGIHILASIVFLFTTIGIMSYSTLNLSSQMIATAISGILLSIGLTEQFTISNKIKASNIQLEKDKIILATEIEVRKSVEKELSESEHKFRMLFELLPHPLILTDFETGIIIEVNNALCQITGFTKDELVGYATPKIGFWTSEDRRAYLDGLKKTRKIFAKNTTIRIKDNKILDVLLYSEIIEIKNQKRIFTLVVDITEIKKQERALQESEKKLFQLNATKDKFFSVIAHDLQNPMQVLLAYSKELMDAIKSNDMAKANKYVTIIKNVIENTTGLTQNLLSWARVQSGLIKFRPESIHAKSFLSSAENFFYNAALVKNIKIDYQCPSDLVLFADNNMMGTVIRNLISNAIKFTNPGGVVSVCITKKNTDFIIEVSDTGIGMSDAFKNNLFKIGENYHSKGTKNETGTGLGLILCSEFVAMHHGTIEVTCNEESGSIFIVKWPAKNE